MSDTSDWYKPLKDPEDDPTVSDVFFGMDEEKQNAVKKLMTYAAQCYIINPQESDVVRDILRSMTDNERKVTYYLIGESLLGESLLNKEDIFNRLECWRVMRGEL